jgi:hypothetical protein
VSNRRRLRGAAENRPAERCSSCSRRIGKTADALRLRTGQVVCPACRQHGEVPRLPCGHYALPGSFTASNSDGSNMQCVQCSPYADRFGAMRYGLAERST